MSAVTAGSFDRTLAMKTEKEARALATHIVKTSSGVVIKLGCTNGEHVLHLKFDGKSETIRSAFEWDVHPKHFANKLGNVHAAGPESKRPA